MVAINKCDLPESDPQKIRNQLLEYELIAEELKNSGKSEEIAKVNMKNARVNLKLIKVIA